MYGSTFPYLKKCIIHNSELISCNSDFFVEFRVYKIQLYSLYIFHNSKLTSIVSFLRQILFYHKIRWLLKILTKNYEGETLIIHHPAEEENTAKISLNWLTGFSWSSSLLMPGWQAGF